MDLRSTRQPLARRLLAHYLMFGLMSIVVFSLSWIVCGHAFLTQEDEAAMRIDELRAQIVADQADQDGAGTQGLVQLLGAEEWVAYVSVISPDGKILAHSNPSRIGAPIERTSAQPGSNALLATLLSADGGERRREYWAPLVSEGRHVGALQVGLIHQPAAALSRRIADHLPVAILLPVTILSIGAIFLRSAARTSVAIEEQLRAVSAGAGIDQLPLHPLNEASPAALGWNRLIERAHRQRGSSTLETKLLQSLGGVQDKRFERILNNLSDGVAVTDKDGGVSYANRPFGILLQRPGEPQEFRGKPIRSLLPARALELLGAAEESRPVVHEVQLAERPADGILRISRSPLLGDANAPTQHIWIIRDVTQQKLADEMRTQFVYSATHELRTPLANIKAYAETLSCSEIVDPEMQKGFLNTINSEATRLARFVEDLLDVSQMEAGALSLAKSEVDITRLLTEAAEKVRPQLNQKRITFDVLLPPKLPKLVVDKDKLSGAVINLLGNAAKYTPEGGRVSFKVVAGAKDLQISVEDTGIGISAAELPKLFTKFFRSADDRVRDLPGSGLGLSFAQEVARLHGGKLIVHSELNKGSAFTLTLPAE